MSLRFRINLIITVVTVLFLPVSFLAGFFGMNFFGEDFNIRNALPSPVLFWLCVSLMLFTPLGMFAWMIRLGMLRPLYRDRPEDRRQGALGEQKK